MIKTKGTGMTAKRNKDKSYVVRNIKQKQKFKYKLILEGMVVGILVGLVIAAFRLLLVKADHVRGLAVQLVKVRPIYAFAIMLALILLAWILNWLLRFEPDISGSGIPQIEGELKGLEDQNWRKVLLAKFAGCILAIGGGLALGREGPSIQLGGMIGKGFARRKNALLTEERLLMSCGAGAGLAAAFGAPLAGVLFALEELHKNFSAEVLISTMAASAAADYVAVNIIGLQPVFNFNVDHRIPLRLYWAVILLGVILGVFGVIYNKTLDKMQDLFGRFHSSFISIGIMMMISFLMMFVYPAVLGSGNDLVEAISSGKFALGALAILLGAKFFFSTGSFGTGTPGGIFLPLLVIGAITGGLYSTFLSNVFGVEEYYIKGFVIIAMAGYFSAIVRAPITGVILITEMTGNFMTLLSLVATSLVAYVVADLLGGEPVYDQLMHRRQRVKSESGDIMPDHEYLTDVYNKEDKKYIKKRISIRERKVVIDSSVHYGSHMDGRAVMDMGLPEGSLIVSVMRDGKEIIPHGSTIINGGDDLEILCRLKDIAATEAVLDEKCKVVALSDKHE
ncbi:ClC family H(+)/Cl(-) exchange transporter [Mogibacterium timidum]|uniref:Chloride channel protein n=1 Tax=Mogibacterium timidum TaxID=35519 RepID=A0A7Y8VQM6_9FIRM|nr:ClC family H(+)/Cl(-) exchange transporter [Mogibacterium timidum]NWO22757.1 chloride channel protein [Mogibacterium timidum]